MNASTAGTTTRVCLDRDFDEHILDLTVCLFVDMRELAREIDTKT